MGIIAKLRKLAVLAGLQWARSVVDVGASVVTRVKYLPSCPPSREDPSDAFVPSIPTIPSSFISLSHLNGSPSYGVPLYIIIVSDFQ